MRATTIAPPHWWATLRPSSSGLLQSLGNVRRSDGIARASFAWQAACGKAKAEWLALRHDRTRRDPLHDNAWGRPTLSQPTAIHAVQSFADEIKALKIFDAGDVQANGFQVNANSSPFETITESGASFMGFAASALLASAAADDPRYMIAFSGDGSFIMNPQILVDAVVHGVSGMIVVFDNRRMGAISSLQTAQYGTDFGTNDHVAIDFVAIANAVSGVRGFFGGYTRAELIARSRRRTPTGDCRWCMCPSIGAATRPPAWAPMVGGMSGPGCAMSRASTPVSPFDCSNARTSANASGRCGGRIATMTGRPFVPPSHPRNRTPETVSPCDGADSPAGCASRPPCDPPHGRHAASSRRRGRRSLRQRARTSARPRPGWRRSHNRFAPR